MKDITISLMISFSMIMSLNAQWTWQNPVPQGNILNSVVFVNADTGWAVGEMGIILKTENGGEKWIPQNGETEEDLKSVYFSSEITGWVIGEKGTILYTSSSGREWIHQSSNTNENLYLK